MQNAYSGLIGRRLGATRGVLICVVGFGLAQACGGSDAEFSAGSGGVGAFGGTGNGGVGAAQGVGAGPSTGGVGGVSGGGTGGTGGVPEACESNNDCPEGVCDLTRRVCVGCLDTPDCAEDEACVALTCMSSPPCDEANPCAEPLVCGAEGRCVECDMNSDCSGGEICVDTQCRPVCVAMNECPDGTVCDLEQGICVGCLSDADCEDTHYCATDTCQPDLCVAGKRTCSGASMLTCAEAGDGWLVDSVCPRGELCQVSGDMLACSGDIIGTGGAGGQGSGGGAGTGGTGGTTAGPNCDELPLIWLLVSTSNSLLDVNVGEEPAFDAIVQVLIGPGGLLGDLQGRARFGLTLYGGVYGADCPNVTTISPGPDSATLIAEALTTARPVGDKQESPAYDGYAAAFTAALAEPEGGGRHILFFGNNTPDFCNDGLAACPQDRVIEAAQRGFQQRMRTLVVGVPTTSGIEELYLKGLANAGMGQPVAPIYDLEDLPFVCDDAPYANYSDVPGNSPLVIGLPETQDFLGEVTALLSGVTCLE